MSHSRTSDPSGWTDEELGVEAERLAVEKRAVRDRQNTVNAEIELRHTLTLMSGAARAALILRLNGGVELAGETAEEAK